MFQFNTIDNYLDAVTRFHLAISKRIQTLCVNTHHDIESKTTIYLETLDVSMIRTLEEITKLNAGLYKFGSEFKMAVNVRSIKLFLSNVELLITCLNVNPQTEYDRGKHAIG